MYLVLYLVKVAIDCKILAAGCPAGLVQNIGVNIGTFSRKYRVIFGKYRGGFWPDIHNFTLKYIYTIILKKVLTPELYFKLNLSIIPLEDGH